MKQLLLDTNVALWLLLGERQSVTRTAVKALVDDENEIALSAVSVWEIAIKRSLGKLEIASNWYRELAALDFTPMMVTAEHARKVEELPWHHRDPFDRLLVSQAIVEDHGLVTADRQLEAYGIEIVW